MTFNLFMAMSKYRALYSWKETDALYLHFVPAIFLGKFTQFFKAPAES